MVLVWQIANDLPNFSAIWYVPDPGFKMKVIIPYAGEAWSHETTVIVLVVWMESAEPEITI